jgi:hypothetical protein
MTARIFNMKSGEQLWEWLFELAPIRRPAVPSTLYEVIVDTADLDTVKRYIAGGHALSQQVAGGHSVALAAAHGDLEFVRYFIENSTDLESVPELLAKPVNRISEADGSELETATAIFDYLLAQPFAHSQLKTAYIASAMTSQYSVAKSIIGAGLTDVEMRAGERGKKTRLSAFLRARGKPDFAALLIGEPVDHEKLLRAEKSERRRNVKLKKALSGLELAGQDYLQGRAFDERYKALLDEIEEGEWDKALATRDPRGSRSVLEFAAINGLADLVRLFLRIDPLTAKKAKQEKFFAAKAAASWGHLNVLRALQEAGVAVHSTPAGSNSPLSEACRNGHVEVVRYLLDAGADPASGDGSGHNFTLIDIAGGEERNAIIAALEAASNRST